MLYTRYVVKLKKYQDLIEFMVPNGVKSEAATYQQVNAETGEANASLIILINGEVQFIAPIVEIEVYQKSIVNVDDKPHEEDTDKDPEAEKVPLEERVDEVAKIIKGGKKASDK